MKVKIGNTVYDAVNEPVMVLLSLEDKRNIAMMSPEDTKYACFPDKMSVEEARAFMVLPPDNAPKHYVMKAETGVIKRRT